MPSEKAFVYKMKLEAMKRQGDRTDLTSCQNGTRFRADNEMAGQVGESAREIQRYIRLTELIPNILNLVDNKKLQFIIAVDISYIDKNIQEWLYEYITENGFIKAEQITHLRKYLELENINQYCMIDILNEGLPGSQPRKKVVPTEKKLKKYFPDFYTSEDMKSIIEKLLMNWKNSQDAV